MTRSDQRIDGTPPAPVTVIGAGSWGTALAIALARNGVVTYLWSRSPEQLAELADARMNHRYLPDCPFPNALHIEDDLAVALAKACAVLVAVPSHGLRETLIRLKPHLSRDQGMVWATKGLEPDTSLLPHQVAADVLGEAVSTAVVAGPTFAREVAQGLPAAITVASGDAGFAANFACALHGCGLRAYTAGDVPGVELGGAVKNVLAIGIGISDGLNCGANARAALITRGLSEMMRLGVALGGQRETFMGLTGLGDLVLTCTDNQSRNRRMGLLLAEGRDATAARREIGQVVEGLRVSREVRRLAGFAGIEMPISEQVYRVLHEGRSPRAAVDALIQRPPKSELT